MGCLGLGIAALLALAVPASIAPASLVGAYIVIVLLAGVAEVVVIVRTPREAPAPVRAFLTIAALAVVYAALVTVIHLAS